MHISDRPHVTVGFTVALGGTITRAQPQPIPWTVLRAWSERYGHAEQDFELLDRCVQALDSVYLKWWGDKQKDLS